MAGPKRSGHRGARGPDDLVGRYLTEIGQYPLLDAAEEIVLAQQIEAGHEAEARLETEQLSPSVQATLRRDIRGAATAKQRFIQSNLRLVVSIAKRYQSTGLPLLDLIQEGNLGLIRAVEKFDHRKGFKFSTYATWWIRQAIGRGVADKGRTIRLPSHVVDTLTTLSKASSTLLKELGREPSSAELSELTGMAIDKVETALSATADVISLSAGIGEDATEFGDLLPDDTAEVPFDVAAANLEKIAIRNLLHTLSDREREVLELRFGLVGERPLTLDEVGRHFELTRERIRQIEAKALTKLRHPCSPSTRARALAV
ncbi:MAG: sigma-70 family RNA polymerase sigma factor [Acidimicrobiales bacterium]